MKNIHVLPTPKPSRLHEYDYLSPMRLSKEPLKWRLGRNIYITNDEEIKFNDYITDGYNVWQWKDDSSFLGRKKIILTTDPQLIQAGVQAIDDEFLEWFVNNPSCEEIEVENIPNNSWGFDLEEPMNLGYKIIIPKEEPKQDFPKFGTKEFNDLCYKFMGGKSKPETLEEATERLYSDKLYPMYGSIRRDAFINGANYQQERSYSEKEVLELLLNCPTNTEKETIEWFEQFKKK